MALVWGAHLLSRRQVTTSILLSTSESISLMKNITDQHTTETLSVKKQSMLFRLKHLPHSWERELHLTCFWITTLRFLKCNMMFDSVGRIMPVTHVRLSSPRGQQISQCKQGMKRRIHNLPTKDSRVLANRYTHCTRPPCAGAHRGTPGPGASAASAGEPPRLAALTRGPLGLTWQHAQPASRLSSVSWGHSSFKPKLELLDDRGKKCTLSFSFSQNRASENSVG